MTGQQIMISVPRLTVAALDEIPNQIAAPEEPVAAVLDAHGRGTSPASHCSSSRTRSRSAWRGS
jgi:chemotaxis protein CheY-P-specific phosphatase CheC